MPLKEGYSMIHLQGLRSHFAPENVYRTGHIGSGTFEQQG